MEKESFDELISTLQRCIDQKKYITSWGFSTDSSWQDDTKRISITIDIVDNPELK